MLNIQTKLTSEHPKRKILGRKIFLQGHNAAGYESKHQIPQKPSPYRGLGLTA